MPTAEEFATWLKVDVWLRLALLGLWGLATLGSVFVSVGSRYVDGPDQLLPYVLGVWALAVVFSAWYAGRVRDSA